MSDRIDLRGTKSEWSDVSIIDFEDDVRRVVDEVAKFSGPFSLCADDPHKLMQFLACSEYIGWPRAVDYWTIYFEDATGALLWSLDHPEIEDVAHNLGYYQCDSCAGWKSGLCDACDVGMDNPPACVCIHG